MGLLDKIAGFFNPSAKKNKKKKNMEPENALEILMLVQEAMDCRDDPERLTAVLSKIQLLANQELGKYLPLLTGPQLVREERPVIKQETDKKKTEIPFDKHEDLTENPVSISEESTRAQGQEVLAPSKHDIPYDQIQPKAADDLATANQNEPTDSAARVQEASKTLDETNKPVQGRSTTQKKPTETIQEKPSPQIQEQPIEKPFAQSEEPKITNTRTLSEIMNCLPDSVKEVIAQQIKVKAPPAEEPAAEKKAPEPEPIQADRFVGKKILYAYGNAENDNLIQQTCSAWQIEVAPVANGLTAVKQFSASAPGTYDAIILEKSMPLMNGFMAAKCIRKDKHPESQSIPVIVAAVGTPVGQLEREGEYLSACLDQGSERELYDVFSRIWESKDQSCKN